MELILVRHGVTVENEQGIHQGQLDGTLSAKGKKQAEETGRSLQDTPVDVVYASTLGRAKDTANILLGGRDLPVRYDARLNEQFISAQYQGKDKSLLDWNDLPPEAESDDVFYSRVHAFLKEMKQKHPEETVLVVAHGGTIIVLKAILTSLTLSPNCMPNPDNCSISRYRISGETAEEIIYNDTQHLASE